MKEMNERELALREKAQEFLNQKARVKHYRISGVFNEEYGDGDTWAIFEYTDEEVASLKHLFSEALVRYLNLPNKEYSLEEIKEEANLWELKGQIEELDEMFLLHARKIISWIQKILILNIPSISITCPATCSMQKRRRCKDRPLSAFNCLMNSMYICYSAADV